MEYTSEYYLTDFKEKVKFYYLRLLFVATALIFFILTGISGIGEGENQGRLGSFINGFENLSIQSAFVKIISSLLIVVLIIVYLYYRNKNRRLIVGVEFTENVLVTETRNIFTSEIETTSMKFNEASVYKGRISDGITNPMYDCYIFMKGNNRVGYLLKNHFMWKKDKIEAIESVLNDNKMIKTSEIGNYSA